MPHQPHLIAETPSPYQVARQAEREKYLDRLRQHLQDPAFRAIEGFPIAEDEAILALSDPPYYTACPNPFLPEIIERWQAEREAGRGAEEQGSADQVPEGEIHASRITHHESPPTLDTSTDDYHREPFAADVSEGKNDPIYNAHSYHTKVPHKAIMRYILHYTEPGDIVFDGFCGTGMTGVAAQLCADRKTVESLGYFTDDDGHIYDHPPPKQPAEERRGKGAGGKSLPRSSAPPLPISQLGARKAVLCDLSPAATFIAYNYNTPVDVTAFKLEAERILQEIEDEYAWLYETLHTDGRTKGRIKYTVWSDVFVCPECGQEMVFWDVAIDKKAGKVVDNWPCPHCRVSIAKSPRKNSGSLKVERAWETIYDRSLKHTIQRTKQVPVLINYSIGKKNFWGEVSPKDLKLVQKIEESDIPYWLPTNQLPEGEKTGDPLNIGIAYAHQFYTYRNLWVLSSYADRAFRSKINQRLLFILTGSLPDLIKSARLRIGAYFHGGRGAVSSGISGTLYVPSLSVEKQVIFGLNNRLNTLSKVLLRNQHPSTDYAVATQSSSDLSNLASNSIDYIFVDPPFGSNLMYSELNFLWEAWLRVLTNNQSEAIVNKVQQKKLFEYQHLMEQCFQEFYRLLKPGRWMTVEFHNSQNSVWNAIQEAILRAGFMVADVRTFNKGQGTFNQVTATGSVKQDLIISAYKPRTDFEQQFLAEGGREKGAWEFARQHLEQLPVIVEKDGALEVVAERQAYLLYDRMVAFHIQRGFSVPLSAAEFYAGLKQRFPERDGMYFLSPQASQYDKRRLQVQRVEQLALFVTDEKSAIQWLNRELDSEQGTGSQTYQDLQPKFLRELHQARHEKLPELRDILEENFLQDEQERWYVPDPNKQEHLEQLREKSLLREFQEYATVGASGRSPRLKTFRTEAVRTGFKRAWADKNYRLITTVAERLPNSVLQEDPGLLMYYDNALMRVEKEPVQGRLRL